MIQRVIVDIRPGLQHIEMTRRELGGAPDRPSDSQWVNAVKERIADAIEMHADEVLVRFDYLTEVE